MKERKRRGALWFVEGDPHTYRHPFLHRGKWRCRRRHRSTGAVEMVSLEAATLTDAREEVQRLATEELRDKPAAGVPAKASTVAQAFDDWALTLDVRPVTLTMYKADIALYKRSLGETKPLESIAYPEVERLFVVDWKGLSGRTKIKHRGMLVRFFDWAAKARLSKGNPARDIVIPRAWSKQSSKAAQTTGQALTLEEARKLLEVCREKRMLEYERERFGNAEKLKAEIKPPPYLWWFVFVSLRTGLRLSNIVGSPEKPGLLWRHVDLDAATLRIEGSLMKNDQELHVPLHAELVEALGARLREMDRVPDPAQRVVPGLRDGQELKKSFGAALERAGLATRDFRIHDLRHTVLSWLGEHCTHAVMQVLAGHSAHSVTDRYAKHQEMDALRKGINSLPRLEATPAANVAKAKA